MNDTDFESILSEHDGLKVLINDRHITPFTKFPSLDLFSNEFIDWLSPTYFEVFTSLFETHMGTNKEAKVVALINAPRYCNVEFKEKINSLLASHLTKSAELSKKLHANMKANGKNLEVILATVEPLNKQVLSYVNKAIFAHGNSPEIKEQKDIIIDNSLGVCSILKRFKASSEIEYNIFNSILTKLRPIDMTREQTTRFNEYQKKSNSSQNKYLIISVIVFILILLRFFSRMSN